MVKHVFEGIGQHWLFTIGLHSLITYLSFIMHVQRKYAKPQPFICRFPQPWIKHVSRSISHVQAGKVRPAGRCAARSQTARTSSFG